MAGIVAIFETQCCKKKYVAGRYSGEREEKMAVIQNYPHVFCDKHERKTPLIFFCYDMQERLGIVNIHTKPLTQEQERKLNQV